MLCIGLLFISSVPSLQILIIATGSIGSRKVLCQEEQSKKTIILEIPEFTENLFENLMNL